MEREVIPLDSTFSRMICTAQSSSERDALTHIVPRPLPETHYMHVEWIDDMRFIIEPRVKAELKTIIEAESYVVEREKLRSTLSFKRTNDLEAYAVENNVKMDLADWRRLLPAQQVAAIVDFLKPARPVEQIEEKEKGTPPAASKKKSGQ